MLSTALVHEIHQMLQEGKTHRKIAAHLGVSRSIVSAIANGSRGLYGREVLDDYSPLTPTSPPTRCPGCGYRVYLPCLICAMRRNRQNQIVLRLLAREPRRALRELSEAKRHLRAS